MKRKLAVLLVFWMAGAGVAMHGQSSSSEEAGHILALETAWNHALEGKDTNAMDMLLAKNIIALDSDGVLTPKAVFLAGIKDPSYQPGQVVNEKINVQVYGDTAIASGVYREKNTEKGKTVLHRASFVDTWVKVDSTWQCVASTAVTIPSKAQNSD
jgi:ketosteroid isomerase-like protein